MVFRTRWQSPFKRGSIWRTRWFRGKEKRRGGYQSKDMRESTCKDLMYFFKVKQRIKRTVKRLENAFLNQKASPFLTWSKLRLLLEHSAKWPLGEFVSWVVVFKGQQLVKVLGEGGGGGGGVPSGVSHFPSVNGCWMVWEEYSVLASGFKASVLSA